MPPPTVCATMVTFQFQPRKVTLSFLSPHGLTPDEQATWVQHMRAAATQIEANATRILARLSESVYVSRVERLDELPNFGVTDVAALAFEMTDLHLANAAPDRSSLLSWRVAICNACFRQSCRSSMSVCMCVRRSSTPSPNRHGFALLH